MVRRKLCGGRAGAKIGVENLGAEITNENALKGVTKQYICLEAWFFKCLPTDCVTYVLEQSSYSKLTMI